jgi:hypothetical protein
MTNSTHRFDLSQILQHSQENKAAETLVLVVFLVFQISNRLFLEYQKVPRIKSILKLD